MLQNIKDAMARLISHRILLMLLVFICLFTALFFRLFKLQIVEGEQHLENFEYKSMKTLALPSARGNIYDSKGNLLAYNKLAYKVTYDNSTDFSEIAKKNNTTVNYELNKVLYNLITMLEKNGDSIINDFPIIMDAKGNFKFSTDSASALKRFHKEVYKLDKTTLSDAEKKQMNATAKEMFAYMRNGTGTTNPGKVKGFDISDEYTDEMALKIMSIRYNINMKRYTQYDSYIIAMDISDKSVGEIEENQDIYRGVGVAADSLRVYNDSKYFSQILGYTGIVSQDQLDTLNKGKKEDDLDYYSNSDIVGKGGIEEVMEAQLQGKKGNRKVFVNNLGKILEETERTDSVAGNDVYLTLDADLQKFCYDTLEQRLAGILLNQMTPGTSRGNSKNRLLPVNDVYFAIIDNNIVDATKFSQKSASSIEKGIYSKLLSKQTSVMSEIKSKLLSDTTPLNKLSDEYYDYMTYIYDMLNTNNVLVSSNIDKNDSMAVAWKNDKASLGEFLRYAIQKSWIDVSVLDISNDFYDIDTICASLADYITDSLKSDTDFDKLMYKYMIEKGTLSGKEVCLTLYEQGVLSKKKDSDYSKLVNGSLGSYNFIRNKIKNREITPGQLALDPCSGSIVVTNPNTGNVLALVSYPGYDTNKLANSVDSAYFEKLRTDKSNTMMNRPLQQKTAPGSTFKPISASAGLETGTITTGTIFNCTGVFDKLDHPPKCHIYPGAHGRLNVVGAIRESCNVFFYNVGYQLGTVNGVYNSDTGLSKLNKYATMFGLADKSGIQLPSEATPNLSDMDAVRSTIGQGTNSFTPIQIARYLTTLANSGTCYDLSILNSVKTSEGKTVKKYKAKVKNKLDLKDSTWDVIHSGMYQVVNNGSQNMQSLFKGAGLDVAGKTGTAQEGKDRANHALFVSYSPTDKPKVATTVVIPHGYTSSYAAQLASDIYKYYFHIEDKNDAEKGKVDSTIINNGSQTD